MSSDSRRAFVAITCRLEDMHAIAVEGQGRFCTSDIHQALAALMRAGLADLTASVVALEERLERGP